MSYVEPPCPPQPSAPFHAECVIVCDRYDDFLAKTLPANKHLFDRVVVVTSPEDKKTQRVCEWNHVECVRTDALESRWGRFCKGAGINAGLEKLNNLGWVVHMDADILLPPQTKLILANADLCPRDLYGIDRFIVKGYEAFAKFQDSPRLQHECDAYIHADAFPLGTRVMSKEAGGYIPIGFFQLWSPSGSGVTRYPEQHTDAGRGDMLFAKQWPRRRRQFIPELIGYHLESIDSQMEANWRGRTTARFTY